MFRKPPRHSRCTIRSMRTGRRPGPGILPGRSMGSKPPIPRIVQPTVRPSDSHGMLDTEPNGAGQGGTHGHRTDRNDRPSCGCPGSPHRSCPHRTTRRQDNAHVSSRRGREVRGAVVHRIVHPARWNLQNVAIPSSSSRNWPRVPRNNRSSRKMLTRNDPMVAHIAADRL